MVTHHRHQAAHAVYHAAHAAEREETHVVAPGETLSVIASRFHSRGWTDLIDWRPIFRLTRERTGLWRNQEKPSQLGNPDLIHPGELLVIPRSRAGYRGVINRINSLKQDTISTPMFAAEVKEEEEHFSKGLNFLSDVLVFVGTLGASAAASARSAQVAKLTVGAAAKNALKEKTLAAVEMGLKIIEYGAETTGHEDVAKYASKASKVVHSVDLVHGLKHGGLKELKELKLKREYWKLIGESVGQVVDGIDVALEWTQPAKLSKGFIKLFTGTDVDAIIAREVEYEKQAKVKLIHQLENKVSKLRLEMQLVYADT
jgi:LysM domain